MFVKTIYLSILFLLQNWQGRYKPPAAFTDQLSFSELSTYLSLVSIMLPINPGAIFLLSRSQAMIYVAFVVNLVLDFNSCNLPSKMPCHNFKLRSPSGDGWNCWNCWGLRPSQQILNWATLEQQNTKKYTLSKVSTLWNDICKMQLLFLLFLLIIIASLSLYCVVLTLLSRSCI